MAVIEVRKFVLASFLLVLIVLVSLACGKGTGMKSVPFTSGFTNVGDDAADVEESPNLTLNVMRDTSGLPTGVRITWLYSTQAGVAGYNIYRSTSSFTDTGQAVLANAVPVTGDPGVLATFEDIFPVTIGDEFFYRITAVDSEGDESPLSDELSIVISHHYITALNVYSGGADDVITILGGNFGDYDEQSDRVMFYGVTLYLPSSLDRSPSAVASQGFVSATVVSWQNEQIEVVVPQFTTSGTVRVQINGVNANLDGTFTSTDPYMLSAAPDPAIEGKLLTITGNNFGDVRLSSMVRLGAVTLNKDSDFEEWSNTEIKLIMPMKILGIIKLDVVVPVKPVSNSFMMNIAPLPDPVIYTVTPLSAFNGNIVTIGGANFAEYVATEDFVSLRGIPASKVGAMLRKPSATAVEQYIGARIISWTDTMISIFVPDYTTIGPVRVDRGSKSVVFDGPFDSLSPAIFSATPDPIPAGQILTLTGRNFGDIRGTSYVRVGNVMLGSDAQYDFWGDTEIRCFVPGGIGGIQDVIASIDGKGQSNALSISITSALLPVIEDVSPQKATGAQQVTITGQHFGDVAGTVNINGAVIKTGAPNLVGWSDTLIDITVPDTADLTGRIKVNTTDGRNSNEWYYRRGVPQDAAFKNESILFAGQMTGIGSDAVNDGAFSHFFSISANTSQIVHLKVDDNTGGIQEGIVTASYPNLTARLATVFDGTNIWLAFVSNNKVYITSSADQGSTWDMPATEVFAGPADIGSLSICNDFAGGASLAWGDIATGDVYFSHFSAAAGGWVNEIVGIGYTVGDVDVAIQDPVAGKLTLVTYYTLATDEIQVLSNTTGVWAPYIGPVVGGGLYHNVLFKDNDVEPSVLFLDAGGNISLASEWPTDPGVWSLITIPASAGLGNGLDSLDAGSPIMYIATGSFGGNIDPYLIEYNYVADSRIEYHMIDINNKYAAYPAVLVDSLGDVKSMHTDVTLWDHWIVNWDTSGAGNHVPVSYGDDFGEIVAMSGDDHLAMDLAGGTGFLFKDATANKLYFGYYKDGKKYSQLIDGGAATDYLVAGLDCVGTSYHVFYQKGTDLTHCIVDVSNPDSLDVGTKTAIASFGDTVHEDIAVLSGSPGDTVMNVLYVETTTATGANERLMLGSMSESAWVFEELANLGSLAISGIDLAMNPNLENRVPVYFDSSLNQLMVGQFDGTSWTFAPAGIAANSGKYPVLEYKYGVGCEAVAFDETAGIVEQLIQFDPVWTQDTISDLMGTDSPYDMWGGALSFAGGDAWGLVTAYYCSQKGEFQYVIREEEGLYTYKDAFYTNPIGDIDYTACAVDGNAGSTMIYQGANDFGLYLCRQDLLAVS